MSEVMYELKSPFKYSYKSESQEAQFIQLTAPSYKQMPKAIAIKQSFTAAISELPDNGEEESESPQEVTTKQVMQIMCRWSGDLSKVMIHAQELFKTGLALVDGETKLTQPLMEKMSADDFELLLGTYIANFIAPSLMDGT